MNIENIALQATDKSNFSTLKGFIEFCELYLKYISDNLQAVIISQNENQYQFYQYDKSGNFQITRPINSTLMYDIKSFSQASNDYLKILKSMKNNNKSDISLRNIINKTTYTRASCKISFCMN